MISELHDLRIVRRDFVRLLRTLNELGVSANSALRKSKKVRVIRFNKAEQRYRSTNLELLEQYKLLAKKLPDQWATREEICLAAGLDPKYVDVPFMWLLEGGKDAKKKFMKPLMQSNGRRGLGGAYKKI